MAFQYGLRDRPTVANRAVDILVQMFNLADAWGWRPSGRNPCRFVRRYKVEKHHERFLTAEELYRLGRALDAAPAECLASTHAAAAIRLLVLTGCRRNEVLGLRWEDLDFEAGEMRLADSKTGARVVPLPPPAAMVLAGLSRVPGNPWVFPGRKKGDRQHNINDSWDRVCSLAPQGLGGQHLDAIGGVTYTVLSSPQPTYKEGKVRVHLSEVGEAKEPVQESKIQTAILSIMKMPDGLSAEDILIVNKVALKTVAASDHQDDGNEGRVEPQSGQSTAAETSAQTEPVGDPDIKKIQAALCLRGSHIDGIRGPQTRQMLIKYQAEQGLTQDGILTRSLRAKLLVLPASEIGARCASSTVSDSSQAPDDVE